MSKNGFKLLSEFAKVASPVSKPFLNFLGANQDGALKTSFTLLQSEGGTTSLLLADNIDLMAGSKDKLTDLARRLTYQHIAFVWKFQD